MKAFERSVVLRVVDTVGWTCCGSEVRELAIELGYELPDEQWETSIEAAPTEGEHRLGFRADLLAGIEEGRRRRREGAVSK